MRALVALNRVMMRLCRPCAEASGEGFDGVFRYWVDQSNNSDLYLSDPNGSDRLKAAFDLHQTDPQTGFAQLWDLAKLGSAWAMLSVGYAYHAGLGVAADEEQAAAWYRRACEHGSEAAVLYLGHLYEELKRLDDAEATYRSSAVGGWAPAMTNLAKLISRKPATAANAREAAYWLRRAAAAGDDVAPAFYAFTRMVGRHGVSQVWPGLRSMIAEAEKFCAIVEDYRSPAS